MKYTLNKRLPIKEAGKATMTIITCLVVISFTLYWFYLRSNMIIINDARVAANMISMSSEIAGQITHVHVTRGQQVNIGDSLVSIDKRSSQLKLSEAQNNLSKTELKLKRSEIEYTLTEEQNKSLYQSQLSKIASTQALVKQANIQKNHTETELTRANSLLENNLISNQLWENKKTEALQAQQRYLKLKADLDKENAELVKTKSIIEETQLLAKDIAILKEEINAINITIERYKLELSIKEIVSPIKGVVDNIFIHVGEYIMPIRRLLLLHDPSNIWVDANIKETQVNQIQLGYKATITFDAYPDINFDATIIHIDNAATSQYALLPNPNPSGSFTKVTQRFTIRLRINNTSNSSYNLKPGMMAQVSIKKQQHNE